MLLISEEVLLQKECAAQVSRGVTKLTKKTIALKKQQQEKINSVATLSLFSAILYMVQYMD